MTKDHQYSVRVGAIQSHWALGITVRAILSLACAIAVCSDTTRSHAQVTINEVLADNERAFAVGGEHPDYVELYNASTQSMSLAGWSLTDDPALPRKYVFPAGTSIGPRGYRLIYCTTNRVGTGLRSGFGLGSSGDMVRLYAANGATVLDSVVFGLQAPDLSIGRVPAGTGAWTLTEPTPLATNEIQTLADPIRLCFNEWMARPASGDDWIEVYNYTNLPTQLGGLVITDQPTGIPANRPIPSLSFVGAHGFVKFLASDLEKPDADHLDFKLSSSGETLTLYREDKTTVIDRVTFGAQQDNISQGRAPDGSDNIIFFPVGGATPDEPNFSEITNVVISEVLSHSDPPLEDAIELQNATDVPVDISYWWLSDSSAQPKKYRIPAGTVLPARGFKVFYANQFSAGINGFLLDSAGGDEVFLSAANSTGTLSGRQTYVEFGALKNGVSVGRFRTTAGVDFAPLESRTFGVDDPSSLTEFRTGTGRSNALPRVGPVVISEIMYQPPEIAGQDSSDYEFIELHNPTAASARLYDVNYPTNRWRVREGIVFDFKSNLTMPAGGYLVLVSFDPAADPTRLAAFRAHYSVPAETPILGPYEGKLSDLGEGIKLLWPDKPEGPDDPDEGFVPYEQVERVRYFNTPPWPAQAAGEGYSLQRHVMLSYGNEPTNWHAATPTPGRGKVADSDGDGMPDDWETNYGLNPQSDADASEDADHDQHSNLEEYLAGTVPTDPLSVLRITSMTLDSAGLRVQFQAAAARTYQVQAQSGRLDSAWLALTNLPALPVPGLIEVFLPQGATNAQYLRVVTPGAAKR